jgi:hypothetical protein
VSSLLRGFEFPDKIKYYLRNVQQQSLNTRLCGYYAVASALAACKTEDVTRCTFDEVTLYQQIQERLSSGIADPVSNVPAGKHGKNNLCVQTASKLHCSCQRSARDRMIQCSGCQTWYHEECVEGIPSPAVNDEHFPWYSEVCCRHVAGENMQTLALSSGELKLFKPLN